MTASAILPLDYGLPCTFVGPGPARELPSRFFPALWIYAMHSPPSPADETLLMQVAKGDREAFAALYDRLATPLYSLGLKMLGSEAEAQDLLQEVFLSVWNKASTFDPERGSAFSWTVTQMRNRAIDRIRSKRRRGELMDTFGPDLEPTGGETRSAADNCQISEQARQVRDAMGKLSDDQRNVLRLAFFEGMTQAEIAKKLHEPLGTIKARAHRAMARLRDILRLIHD
jgi:RNA polymerase sigma-70 factor (ECF subfamily)